MAASRKQQTVSRSTDEGRGDDSGRRNVQDGASTSATARGDQREVYVKRARTLMNLFGEMHNVANHAEVGSMLWQNMTRSVDVAYRAVRGRAHLPMSRMLLLECIDYATSFRQRIPRCRELSRIANGSDKEAARQADKELHLETFIARNFEEKTSLRAVRNPVDLIIYDFSTRCPEHAEAIRSPETRQVLERFVESWVAGPGRPKGGQRATSGGTPTS
jgi:hypothetical protein